MTPKTAIIIVTYNGSRYIIRCLTSVFNNDYDGRLDVIVVDNNSTDDTAAIVKNNFPQVELIQLPRNLGFVGGNNVGIKKALSYKSPPFQGGARGGYDYVILLNQDTEVAENWLDELVKVAQEKEAGIIQSMLLLPPLPDLSAVALAKVEGGLEPVPYSIREGVGEARLLTNNVGNAMHYLGFGFVKHYREPASGWLGREPFEIGYASGAAMLIKREAIDRISPPYQGGAGGVLDEKFFAYHEDLDLCWRARLAGYKIIIAPRAVVYHYYQFHRNKKMFYWTERNRWACLLQNYSLRTLLLLSPMLVAIELMLLAYSLLTGWFLEKLKSYVWILAHLLAIIARRRQIQSRRVVSDKEILRQMDAKLEFSEVDNFLVRRIVSPLVVWYYKIVEKLIS